MLRAFEPEDLEVTYQMENDPGLWTVTNFTVPYSRFALRQYLTNAVSDLFTDRQVRLMIELRSSGQAIGSVDLTNFSPMHARGELGMAILNTHRGKGLGGEALELMCRYAFGYLHLHQLTTHVDAGNAACLSMLASCGFERCGLLRQWWRTPDGYRDVVLMQRLAEVNMKDK